MFIKINNTPESIFRTRINSVFVSWVVASSGRKVVEDRFSDLKNIRREKKRNVNSIVQRQCVVASRYCWEIRVNCLNAPYVFKLSAYPEPVCLYLHTFCTSLDRFDTGCPSRTIACGTAESC